MAKPESRSDVEQRVKDARDFRVKVEAKWMEIDHFIDGDHYVMYDKQEHSIRVIPSVKRGEIRRVVNLIKPKLDNTSNLITKNPPEFNIRANITPGMSEEEIENAKKESSAKQAICVNIYRKAHVRHKIKRWARLGLKRGLAIAERCWDEDKDEVDVQIYDPFDVLIDPLCKGEIQDAQYIIKTLICSKKQLEETGLYKDLDKVDTTTKQSSSEYRNSYLNSKFSVQGGGDAIEIREMWYKEKVSEVDEEGEKREGVVIKLKTTSSCGKVIRETTTPYKKYPFVIYYPRENNGELYPRPFCADLIPLNKTINRMHSFTEEYLGSVGQGRYLLHNKTKFTTQSTGAHGQIMRWSGQNSPAVMPTPPMPYQVIDTHTHNTERYMAEIGGVQFLDAGKVMSSNMSGRAIGQLQAQQSESVGEPTDNLAFAVQQLFEGFLEMVSDNVTEPQYIPSIKKEDDEVYKIRGKNGIPEGAEAPEDEIIIDGAGEMRVEIVPGGVFSELYAQDNIMALQKAQLVDKETVLDTFKIGNTREILENMEREQAAAKKAKEEAQASQGQLGNLVDQEKQLMSEDAQLTQQLGELEGQMMAQGAPPQM